MSLQNKAVPCFLDHRSRNITMMIGHRQRLINFKATNKETCSVVLQREISFGKKRELRWFVCGVLSVYLFSPYERQIKLKIFESYIVVGSKERNICHLY